MRYSYTYNSLINKSDIPITTLSTNIPSKPDGSMDRSAIISNGLANIRFQNNPKNTSCRLYVHVNDIDTDVLVNSNGLRHALTRKSENTAIVTANIGDILKNAIKINELNPKDNIYSSYILLGIVSMRTAIIIIAE